MEIFFWLAVAAIVAFSFAFVAQLYIRVAHREVQPDSKGWLRAKPGPISYVLGLGSVVASIAFTGMTVGALASALGLIQPFDDSGLYLLIGAPMSALMIFSSYLIFWVRLRAAEKGLSYRGLRGWQTFSWDEIEGVRAHSGLGPYLKIQGERSKFFWPYGYGFNELGKYFVEKNLPYDLG